MKVPNQSGGAGGSSTEDDGFMLIAVLVLVFLVLLTLSVAAPRMAMQLKHDQEMETQHRANQYVRAIRMYYKKMGHYPGSIEQLDKSNNQKFLRQHYLDPLTGKDDWKLIQVGQNKTTVKGFFGEDLPGLGGGLGAAAGMASGTGSSTTGSSTGSSFGGTGSGSSFGGSSSGSSFGGSSFGSGGTTGATGSTGSSSSSGIGDQNATDYKGGGGPIMGVGVGKSGEAFLTVNEKSTYEDWEFLYDPRIEALYAKANLLGGGGTTASGTGIGTGTGTGTGMGSGFGNSGFGSSGATGSTGSTGATGSTGSTGSTTTPQ